jgi:hypothetical protein
VALGAAVVPAARGAAADNVAISSVSVGPGTLAISTTSDTGLTSLAVTLTSASNPDVLSFTIADFTQSAGTNTDGTWALNQAITVSHLPRAATGST